MKSTLSAPLLVGDSALAQDISNPPGSATSPSPSATSQGTIDQPTAAATDYNPSPPSQPSATLAASAPLQPSAPLSPGLPMTPTTPLSVLMPQQPSQISSTTASSDPQQPTPSAPPPTPLIVGSADGTAPTLQSSAHALALAARTLESLQNMSNSLNNLVKVKSN